MQYEAFLISNESTIRLAVFLGLCVLFIIFESAFPRRPVVDKRFRYTRWFNHFSLSLMNSVLLKLVFPMLAVGMAVHAEAMQWGLLNNFKMPWIAKIIIGFLVLDFCIYLQHIAFHKIPFLWRMHRMHHSDVMLDVSSGIRFHPFEILLSMLIKIIIVLALGIPVLSVLIFELVLNACSLFNHSNWNITVGIDKWLRMLFVTPDMHRIHHSIYPEETDSNFGFNFSFWDRLLGTYCDQPRDGQLNMQLGLEYFRKQEQSHFFRLLMQFRNPKVEKESTQEGVAQETDNA